MSGLRGFLVVDKPAGPTSHDVVGILRSITGIKRIGHTGTLDPFATGALPLAIGSATRLIPFLDEGTKRYRAVLKLGQETDTLDVQGTVTATAEVPALDAVDALIAAMVGPQMQRPPAYSAVRVDGQRLYTLARAGKPQLGAERPIHVYSAERVPDERPDHVGVELVCSRGTYVRVLGQELAIALGTVGHLVALRRLSSGPFDVGAALSFQELAELACGTPDWARAFTKDRDARLPRAPREQVVAGLAERLVSPRDALAHLPEVTVPDEVIWRVQAGQRPPLGPETQEGDRYRVTGQGRLLAVAEHRADGGKSVRVVPP